MLNYPSDLSFSETHRIKRLQRACALLGQTTVRRLLGYSLFLLGANREETARWLEMPVGTFFSFLNRVEDYRLDAFCDRRQTHIPPKQQPAPPPPPSLQLRCQGDDLVIEWGGPGTSMTIPRSDEPGCRSVVLRLVENELLPAAEAARLLDCSPRHIANLLGSLREGGVAALLDQRLGQRHDYRFDEKVKAELVQQFAANAICGESVSSGHLAAQLEERCQMRLAPRSIRHHVKKLGLRRIVATLPELVETVKKTPDTL